MAESKNRVDAVQPFNILVQLVGVLLEETPEREIVIVSESQTEFPAKIMSNFSLQVK